MQGLRSGRVQAVLWERDGSSGHQRSLLQEVDFFRDLGMAVYLVGAQQQGDAETQDVELGPVLSVHPRLYFGEEAVERWARLLPQPMPRNDDKEAGGGGGRELASWHWNCLCCAALDKAEKGDAFHVSIDEGDDDDDDGIDEDDGDDDIDDDDDYEDECRTWCC